MAALHCFPAFHPLSPHKIFFSSTNFSVHHCGDCYLRFSASSSKKSRFSKKEEKNVNLGNEIREFLSTVGFPDDHVPSIKEFSQHGRQDLAKIVRRRGYKFIRQLLQTSTTTNFESIIGTENAGNSENEKLKGMANDVLSSDIHGNFYRHQGMDGELYPNDKSPFASASTATSLQEKVAKFIKYGELDEIVDQDPLITAEIYAKGEKNIESDDAHEPKSSSRSQDNGDLFLFSSSGDEILNGNVHSPVSKFENPDSGNNISRNSYVAYEETTQMAHDNNLDVENSKAKNLTEVERLKSMLHQKELELDHLKHQIEKEKASLLVLQNKVETETNKARKLISEKETELHAAEGSLSGLKEVEIQYSGDGETVELAGSFNGWHHNIRMDTQPSSSNVDPIGSRNSRHWRTVLWLYPGIYEIKFVVDGHWRIDPSRELITRNSLHNNILKVDR